MNAAGAYGNLGKRTLEGPGNVLNHASFNNPPTSMNNANFGRVIAADDPRILQFALKFSF